MKRPHFRYRKKMGDSLIDQGKDQVHAARKTFCLPASAYLYKRYIAGDPARDQVYEEEVINAEIAPKLYELRTKAGLTQQELVTRVGASKSAVCLLEDAGYDGRAFSMMKRIAEALGKRIEIRFVPAGRLKSA